MKRNWRICQLQMCNRIMEQNSKGIMEYSFKAKHQSNLACLGGQQNFILTVIQNPFRGHGLPTLHWPQVPVPLHIEGWSGRDRPNLHQVGYSTMKAVYKRQEPHNCFLSVLKCTAGSALLLYSGTEVHWPLLGPMTNLHQAGYNTMKVVWKRYMVGVIGPQQLSVLLNVDIKQ